MPRQPLPPSEEVAHIESLLAERLAGRPRLLRFQPRPASRLYRYELVANAERMRLIVKVPLLRPSLTDSGRPRLMIPTEAERKASLEFDALRGAEEHFASNGDGRLGVATPLLLLESVRALVTREVSGDSLRTLVRRSLVPGRDATGTRLVSAMHLAGEWLRTYHRIQTPAHIEERLTTAAAIAQFALEVAGYLRDAAFGREAHLIAGELVHRVDQLGDLPLAVVHGDYAMRNVIVEGGTVRVLDMLGRWRAPADEDVANMTVALDTIALRMRLGGLVPLPGVIGRAKEAFLAGYYGEASSVPRARLAVMRGVLLLDRLAALHERGTQRRRLLERGLLRLASQSLSDAG